MSVKQDLVRPKVREALAECIEAGSWDDVVSREAVQHAVLMQMGIDPVYASRYGFIMTVIAEEIQIMFNQVVGQYRMPDGIRRRSYMGIKLTAKGVMR